MTMTPSILLTLAALLAGPVLLVVKLILFP